MDNWTPEVDEEVQSKVLEYQVKCHIALEDSDTQAWGIAKDTEGSFVWEPGGGSIVGTWSRSPHDGLTHVFLETPLMALVDKATQRFAEYAEKRRLTATTTGTRPRRAPKAAPEPEINENLAKIGSLRKLFS